MTKQLFRGNPRLLIATLPWAVGVVVLKLLAHRLDLEPLEFSPLLAGAIGAEVFILGFLLSGTAGDFKEAEKLPGEIAASLETMADECLITSNELGAPAARECLAQLIEISASVRRWLLHDRGLDDVLSDIRALNAPFAVMAPLIQPGFVTRLKGEQANVRRVVIRMDTVRRTSYVAAGYLIAEVTLLLLVTALVLTTIDPLTPTVFLIGLNVYLLLYLVGLIRDLDNPFEYLNGEPGAADVDLSVLERNEDRLRALLGALDAEPSPAVAAAAAAAVSPDDGSMVDVGHGDFADDGGDGGGE